MSRLSFSLKSTEIRGTLRTFLHVHLLLGKIAALAAVLEAPRRRLHPRVVVHARDRTELNKQCSLDGGAKRRAGSLSLDLKQKEALGMDSSRSEKTYFNGPCDT